MFRIPTTRVKVQLHLTAEVDLNQDSDQSEEEQLQKILEDFSNNPHYLNKYRLKQELTGELFTE